MKSFKLPLTLLFLIVLSFAFFMEQKLSNSLNYSIFFTCLIGTYLYINAFLKSTSFILHGINFSFLFTFAIPYFYQVINSVHLMDYDISDYTFAIYINLILSIIFIMLLNIFIKWEKPEIEVKKQKILYNRKKALFLTILTILISIYIYFSINQMSVLFSTRDVAYLLIPNSKIIYYFILLPKVLISGMSIYLIYLLKENTNIAPFIFYILLLLIINFIISYPASTPRFIIASFYLGIALVLVDYNKLKTRILFMIFMPLSYYTIFTYLSATTRAYDQGSYNLFNILSFKFLGTLDFDTFFTGTLAIQYVNENSPSLGLGLISALLVVFPRSIWTSKLLPAGDIFNSYFNLPYTNTSCNLVCESYMNFSIFGVLIFFFILSNVNKLLLNIKKTNFFIIYVIVSVYFILIYRGSLAAAFTYLTPLIVLLYIIIKLSESKKT